MLVCSRWWPGVDAVAGLPWARPLLTARNRAELLTLRQRVRGPRASYGVKLHRSLLTPTVVAELRERVELVLVLTWGSTTRPPSSTSWRGVNGVISDSGHVLAQVKALFCR